MIPYLSLFFISLISTFFDKSKLEKNIFYFISIFLIFILTLRGNSTGPADYEGYLMMYEKVNTWMDVIEPTVHAEIGFRLLSFFGNYHDFQSQFIIFIMGMLSILPILYIINKYSYYRNLSILIWLPYFFTMNMHSSRTSVAAAFGILFIFSFIDKEKIKSIIYFLLAFSFHSSALILILIYLIKINIQKLTFILTISFFIIFFIDTLKLITIILSFFDLENYATILNNYRESSDYGYPMKLYDPRIILSLTTIILLYRIRKRLTNKELLFYKIYIIGSIILILFSISTIVAWRVSYYFLIISIIIIPLIAKYYNSFIFQGSKIKRFMSTGFILIYTLYIMKIILNAEPYILYKELM